MDDGSTPESRVGPAHRACDQSATSPTFGHPASLTSKTITGLPRTDGPFGAGLGDQLREACAGRLGQINFFRTDWQRGGALTGYSTFHADDGEHAVVVKFPVPPRERRWLVHLQAFDNVAPRLYAHGDTIGSHDMAWVIMERLPHGPLGSAWNGHEFDLLLEAAGRFYAAAAHVPVENLPPEKDWHAAYELSRRHIEKHDLGNEQRWKVALKAAHKKLDGWLKLWAQRPRNTWCHGDLHLANGLTRVPPPDGPAVLIDYAEVRPGCWVEDAIYFEYLFWARRQRLAGRRLCSQLAHELKKHGLDPHPRWPDFAQVRRALLAMSTPAMLEHAGDPHHVQAALEMLESLV